MGIQMYLNILKTLEWMWWIRFKMFIQNPNVRFRYSLYTTPANFRSATASVDGFTPICAYSFWL